VRVDDTSGSLAGFTGPIIMIHPRRLRRQAHKLDVRWDSEICKIANIVKDEI